MVEIDKVLITTWILQIISNTFSGIGLGLGVYLVFKRFMPSWVVQINKAIRENHAIDKATRGRSY